MPERGCGLAVARPPGGAIAFWRVDSFVGVLPGRVMIVPGVRVDDSENAGLPDTDGERGTGDRLTTRGEEDALDRPVTVGDVLGLTAEDELLGVTILGLTVELRLEREEILGLMLDELRELLVTGDDRVLDDRGETEAVRGELESDDRLEDETRGEDEVELRTAGVEVRVRDLWASATAVIPRPAMRQQMILTREVMNMRDSSHQSAATKE